jgi:hypothetical protein
MKKWVVFILIFGLISFSISSISACIPDEIVINSSLAPVKTGYIFGLNLSTITLKINGVNSKANTPAGIHFGGFIEVPIKGRFTLQPGLLFSAKGSDYKIDTIEYSISPIYIEVPVMACYSFGSDVFKVSLFAGPYFACGVGGYKLASGGRMENISFGSGKNYDIKPFDIGFNFGAGINIKGLLISAQYGKGLVNISPVASADIEMKNKVIGISISSSFPGK